MLGIIFAANKTVPGGFTERDERLLGLFAAHAAIALINARLYERVGELSVMEERARLARELHDAVSQKLFSIRAKARAASVLADRDPARAAAEMDSVAALSGEAHAELRAVISGLAPPELGEHGLAESLRRYAALAGMVQGVQVRFCASDIPALGAGRDAAAYRIAQEALHNALRHSGAGQIEISLHRTARRVVLEVTDDGRGFSPDAPGARPGAGVDAGAGGRGRRHPVHRQCSGLGDQGHAGPPGRAGRAAMTAGQADADGRDGDPAGGYRADRPTDQRADRRRSSGCPAGPAGAAEVQDDIDVVGEAADGTEAAGWRPSSAPT